MAKIIHFWLIRFNQDKLIEPSRFNCKNGKNHPFLVRFGLNLGLNNLKFGQEAIFDLIESIRLNRVDSSEASTPFVPRVGITIFLA